MGALSHLSMYSSAHLHVMCFRTARSKSSWSMLSNDPTTSYPSQGPTEIRHHHSPAPSVRRKTTGGLWPPPPPGQAPLDPRCARWKSHAHTTRVDRSCALAIATANETGHDSRFNT